MNALDKSENLKGRSISFARIMLAFSLAACVGGGSSDKPPIVNHIFTLSNAQDAIIGGKGDDTINGTDLTAQADDKIDGGDGNDSLVLTDWTDAATFPRDIQNVENLIVRVKNGRTYDIDFGTQFAAITNFANFKSVEVFDGNRSNIARFSGAYPIASYDGGGGSNRLSFKGAWSSLPKITNAAGIVVEVASGETMDLSSYKLSYFANLRGTPGDETLIGAVGRNVYEGGGGNDYIKCNSGGDEIYLEPYEVGKITTIEGFKASGADVIYLGNGRSNRAAIDAVSKSWDTDVETTIFNNLNAGLAARTAYQMDDGKDTYLFINGATVSGFGDADDYLVKLKGTGYSLSSGDIWY